jgi:ATP-dependent exoDNAse (exonuclease V) beta subunit
MDNSQPVENKRLELLTKKSFWRRSSFSALLRQSQDLAQVLFAETSSSLEEIGQRPQDQQDRLSLVPRGTEVGILWHLMLQRALQLLQQQKSLAFIEKYLTSEAFRQKEASLLDETSIQTMATQVVKLLDMPWSLNLSGQKISFQLAALAPGTIWTEKKFELSANQVSAWLSPGKIGQDPVQLSGVMDAIVRLPQGLVFIDWKSNWLGPGSNAYTPESLIQNALHHRYDLQARIYSQAIETSLLTAKKGPLLGGLYVYLRGSQPLVWNVALNRFESQVPALSEAP